jgi:hydrogenase maturation protease
VSDAACRSVLVVGVGNPGRGDDGIGPALVERLEADAPPGLALESTLQLSLEHAAALAEHATVLFVDAAVGSVVGRGRAFALEPLAPGDGAVTGWSTHAMAPADVLAVSRLAFGAAPDAWLLAVRGRDFRQREGLSAAGRRNLAKALEAARTFIGSALLERSER